MSVSSVRRTDVHGNAGSAGSTHNFCVYTVTPTVAVSINSSDVNVAANTATVTFTFSEATADFTLADTTATGGTLGPLSTSDGGLTYTATFTAAAGVDITDGSVSVTNASWTEDHGNAGTGGSTPNFVVDTVT